MKRRSYGRMELAMEYCPGLRPTSAWRCLRQWIAKNRDLCRQLAALGYDGHQRVFTPAQVQAIVNILGEP